MASTLVEFFKPEFKKLFVLFIFLYLYSSISFMLLTQTSYRAALSAAKGDGVGLSDCLEAFWVLDNSYLGAVYSVVSGGINSFCHGLAPEISIPFLLIYWYVLASVVVAVYNYLAKSKSKAHHKKK